MSEHQTAALAVTEPVKAEPLDVFGEAVCALKPAFRAGYNAAAARFRAEQGRSLRGYLPAICGCDGVKGAENIHKIRELDDIALFPAVTVSFGLGEYFSSRFLGRFTGKGYFKRLSPPVQPVFEQSGLLDPNGEFFIFSVMPTVLLVDENRLAGRQAPRRWGDLLAPEWEGDVVLPAAHGAVSPLLPLTILRDSGEAGIDALARNVREAKHATDSIRAAGHAADGAAVYAVPWFFARACPNPGVRIVWPEDGALVEPSFLLVRAGQADTYRPVLDFIAGEAYGRACAAHNYPAARPGVPNGLPDGARFNWLGWDFIREAPLEARTALVKARFAHLPG